MKFYRASYSTGGGNSGGFSWHTSRAEAIAAAKRDYDEDPAEYDHHAKGINERIQVIEITPTRRGILDALQRLASHPDNG